MGEDFGSWFSMNQFVSRSPNMAYMGAPAPLAEQNTVPLLGNSSILNQALPKHPLPQRAQPGAGQANELQGWFYCVPQIRQAFMPASNSTINQKASAAIYGDIKREMPKADSVCTQKKFLVFDQSGDQTTLIFSSGVGPPPPQRVTSWIPKPTGAYNFDGEEQGIKENLKYHVGPVSMNEFGENNDASLQSEMHEDTEELNALLYSDDDSEYTGDDEVTSTGHSPSTMTAFDKQDGFERITEEVASSDGSIKKRKFFYGCCSDVPALMDTATSARAVRGFEHEDDAESRCANSIKYMSNEMGSVLGHKRMRKERIRETLSVLQNIIPDGKGKDVITVLDEAIQYLKSLKHKAKELGLDNFLNGSNVFD